MVIPVGTFSGDTNGVIFRVGKYGGNKAGICESFVKILSLIKKWTGQE